MVLHELATNAGKYGALSVPEGRVAIAWTRVEGTGLSFQWAETDGPPPTPTPRKGFGLKLIDRETAYNLGGRAEVDLAEGGLTAKITLPLESS
jgi:two-component sensor histidine kinase